MDLHSQRKGPMRKAATAGRRAAIPEKAGTVLKVGLGKSTRLILASLLFAGSTWWALTRFSRPDPFQSPALFSLSWFLRPLEVNAPARLPVVSGTLTSIAVSEDRSEAYIAGQQGLLLRYDHGTQEWENIPLPDSLALPSPEEETGNSIPREPQGRGPAAL